MSGADPIETWWSWIAPSTLQATALLVLAWLLDRALARRAWPLLLRTIWLLALARLLLPPSISSPWSLTRSIGAPTIEVARAARGTLPLEFIAAAWLVGVACVATARCVRRARFAGRLEPVNSPTWASAVRSAARRVGLRRLPRLAVSRNLPTPAVAGLARPTLLLPPRWLDRAPTGRDVHALLHELAHLKRRDLWLDEACEILRALFWFHPLVWIAVGRVRALGELACDESVARLLGREAPSYRDTLVLAARERLLGPSPSVARAFAGNPSLIALRIERLERAATGSLAAARSFSAATAALLAGCLLPMAPSADGLLERARAVLAAEVDGDPQSCFALHAAAIVLAAQPSSAPEDQGD